MYSTVQLHTNHDSSKEKKPFKTRKKYRKSNSVEFIRTLKYSIFRRLPAYFDIKVLHTNLHSVLEVQIFFQ